MAMRVRIGMPDDWHLHLRDGEHMRAVLPHTVKQFRRAIIMPNLLPAATTTAAALAYRERIMAVLPEGSEFEPLMTLYLTDNTTPDEIKRAHDSGYVHAVKCYPAGASTNSASGVTDIRKCYKALEAMIACGMPLLYHGEVTDSAVDVFDRELEFLERIAAKLVEEYPELRLVLEHITTREAADFVKAANENVAATITAHHLLLNRNALFFYDGKTGSRPHHYCLPIIKRELHRQALLEVIRLGNRKFFLGTDSAPHARHTKETSCGCAGVFTAHAALELYAEAFKEAGAMQHFNAFAHENGADYYRLPRNSGFITLDEVEEPVAETLPFGDDVLVPFRAGEKVQFKLIEVVRNTLPLAA